MPEYITKSFDFKDRHLGIVHVRVRSTAKYLKFGARNNEIIVSMPPMVSVSSFVDAFKESYVKLLELKKKQAGVVQNLYHDVKCDFLSVKFEFNDADGNLANFRQLSKPGEFPEYVININSKCGGADPDVVKFVKKKMIDLARLHTLKFVDCRPESILISECVDILNALDLKVRPRKIGLMQSSFTVFGKCSSTREIKLSPIIAYLPKRLRWLVYCHELAHLTEMNHSERFHKLLNQYTDGFADRLEAELKSFSWGFPR